MSASDAWHSTACILCSLNCGIEVQTDGSRMSRIRGDKKTPSSTGYLCQKAGRLDYYQNNRQRLSRPMKRVGGKWEAIGWDQAIREIAEKLVDIRDTHGGETLAYAGGGGQGNHLGGVYGAALRAAMRTPYYYSALAQEKTGDFWVNGKLFGKQTCHITEDIEHCDLALFIGTNPWMSHGIARARKTLLELSKDPARKMIVIDPRKTETAKLADQHLALRPGTDALLLSAILGTLVQENLVDQRFLDAHTIGFEAVCKALGAVPIDAHAKAAGISPEEVRSVARALAGAKRACVRVDLGVQQTRNSTLNSYLEKLCFLLTGNFAKQGGNNLHTFLLPLIGHSGDPEHGEKVARTQVNGMQEIGKLFPPNLLASEIDSDHPKRLRGLVTDSCNPIKTYTDTVGLTKALAKLDLLVVIDVVMTETAELAHYVLPAPSQYEKWEATFFSLSFPRNYFHLRKPLFSAPPETLPEPEIYRRLVVAMGECPDRFPLLSLAAKADSVMGGPRRLFPPLLALTLKRNPRLLPYAALLLKETLGKTLDAGADAAAPLWFACRRYAEKNEKAMERAGYRGTKTRKGEALFEAILRTPSGVVLSEHQYEDCWQLVGYPDKKIRLEIKSLLAKIPSLLDDEKAHDAIRRAFPFMLIAGDRRSYNAGAILRDPDWRKKDREGALMIHPKDAATIGVRDGESVRVVSETGSLVTEVTLSDAVPQGLVSMPTGYGMDYPEGADPRRSRPWGPGANLLTSSGHCDPLTKTPLHKNVPVRLEKA